MATYILLEDKKTYREESDIFTWGKWFEDVENRRLHDDRSDTYRVSTTFLGIDHGCGESSGPVLFETMVFKVKESGKIDWSGVDQERYTGAEEATEGHKRFCEKYNVTTTL